MPRSGVDGPRFAFEWIPVHMKARGSQPITQQRQEKAGATSRGCPPLYLRKVDSKKSQSRDHTTIVDVLECISDVIHVPTT